MKDHELWYPAFNLKRNPFAEVDDMTSFHRLVKNEAWTEVTASLQSQESIIVVGPMGSGKTNMARNILENREFQKELLNSLRIEKCCGSIGRNRIIDIKGDSVKKGLIDAAIDLGTQEFLTVLRDTVRIICNPCKDNCLKTAIKEKDPDKVLEKFEWLLRVKQEYSGWERCELAQKFEYLAPFLGELLVVDCPNVLEPGFIRELDTLAKYWLGFPARRLLLFCTPDQHKKLTKTSDLFKPEKIRVIQLGNPEPSFFHKLVDARTREDKAEDDTTPNPFNEEAITLIHEAADHNPRQFIKLCSSILTESVRRHRTEPIDKKFLSELNVLHQPQMSHIDEAFGAYRDTANRLKLLLEQIQGFEAWTPLTDHSDELSKMLSCKPRTLYKYIENLESLNLIESKMMGKPPRKFIRTSRTIRL
jgi:hypothetical protein